MSASHDIINKQKMQEFANELEKEVIGKRNLLALDIFYVHKFYVSTAKSFTYAVPKYLNKLLPIFLKDYGSMGGIDYHLIKDCALSRSKRKKSKLQKLEFKQINFTKDEIGTKATFENLVEFLQKNSFGEYCFWINVFLLVEGAQTNLSAFLITRNNAEDYKNEIERVVKGFLLNDFYALVTSEFVSRHTYTLELIKAHKHTIKNFGFEGHLTSLYSKIKQGKYDEALQSFEHLEKLSVLRDYTTDILYSFNEGFENLLLVKHKHNSYTGILKLINDAVLNKEDEKLIMENDAEMHKSNTIKDNHVVDVFALLINLYSNGSNQGDFSIHVYSKSNSLYVKFSNNDELAEPVRNFLLGHADDNETKGEGLRIIKAALSKLSNVIIKIPQTSGRTEIILQIQ